MSIQEERLYYGDSYLQKFTSEVCGVRQTDAGYWVRLKQSAFYPTSGGQPHDIGLLNEAHVTNVEADEEGVWHKVDSPLAMDEFVTGTIDFERRFDFVQQHSGQHVLSACFEQMRNVDTVSFHMGDSVSTIDLDIAELADALLERIELAANQWIWRDVPIRARFVAAEELAQLHLRRPPKVEKDVRIVTIEGLEHNPCGGTHPASTGQIGQIAIIKTERMRGGIRVSFVCGRRALAYSRQLTDTLRALGNQLSVGLPDFVTTVEGLQTQLKEARKGWHDLKQQMAGWMARDVLQHAQNRHNGLLTLITDVGTGFDVNELKPMVGAVTELLEAEHRTPYLVALIGKQADREFAVVVASENSSLAANALLKEAFAIGGGKGGGNARTAQGSAPWAPEIRLVERFLQAMKSLENEA